MAELKEKVEASDRICFCLDTCQMLKILPVSHSTAEVHPGAHQTVDMRAALMPNRETMSDDSSTIEFSTISSATAEFITR